MLILLQFGEELRTDAKERPSFTRLVVLHPGLGVRVQGGEGGQKLCLTAPWSKALRSGADRDCFVSISIRAVFLWILSVVFLFHQFVIYFSDNMSCHSFAFSHRKQES